MLIDDGKIAQIGDPGEVGMRYLRLNFERGAELADTTVPTSSGDLRIAEAWLEDASGAATSNIEQGEKVRLAVELEVLRDVAGLHVGFVLANADGFGFSQWGIDVEGNGGERRLRKGERLTVRSDLENILTAGRYFIHCGVSRNETSADVALYVHNAIDFVIYGNEGLGLVQVPHQTRVSISAGGTE
jgi:hypothetical protein